MQSGTENGNMVADMIAKGLIVPAEVGATWFDAQPAGLSFCQNNLQTADTTARPLRHAQTMCGLPSCLYAVQITIRLLKNAVAQSGKGIVLIDGAFAPALNLSLCHFI